MLDTLNKEESGPKNIEVDKKTFKILFIEDHPDVVEALRDLFGKKTGISIQFSSSGEDALDILRKESVNLVIADWNLGKDKLDGIGVAEIVRKERLAPQTLILTGKAEDLQDLFTPEQFQAKGIGGIIPKAQMGKLLGNAINKEQLRQQNSQLPQK